MKSSSVIGTEFLAKESLMRSTLLRVASLIPSLTILQQLPNGIYKTIPDITNQVSLHAVANFWAL